MKLYTELDVKTAILQTIFACKITTHDRYKNNENIECDILGQLTPIELPSDEEIRNQTQFATNDYYFGAIWMKKFILNQNK